MGAMNKKRYGYFFRLLGRVSILKPNNLMGAMNKKIYGYHFGLLGGVDIL